MIVSELMAVQNFLGFTDIVLTALTFVHFIVTFFAYTEFYLISFGTLGSVTLICSP